MCAGEVTDGIDFQLLENCNRSMTSHKQTGNGKRPHFLLYLFGEQSMSFIWLFKVRSHLCKHFVGGDSHINCKSKLFKNVIADISSSGFRGGKMMGDSSVVKKTLINTHLFDFWSERTEKPHKFFAVSGIELMIRRDNSQRRTLFQGACYRLCRLDMVNFLAGTDFARTMPWRVSRFPPMMAGIVRISVLSGCS